MSPSTPEPREPLASLLAKVASGAVPTGRLFVLRRARAIPGIDERLTLDGERGTLWTPRSIADVSGEEIGLFELTLSPAEARQLADALSRAWSTPAGKARTEAGELRIELTVGVENVREERSVQPSDHTALAPYQDALDLLDTFAFRARQRPVRALGVQLALEPNRSSARQRGTLTLRNVGTEGLWVDRPRRRAASPSCLLEHAPIPQAPPGVTPLPPELTRTPLEFAPSDDGAVWLAGGAAEDFPFTVEVLLPAGPFLARAIYEAPLEPSELDDRRPRFGGTVFSDERRIP